MHPDRPASAPNLLAAAERPLVAVDGPHPSLLSPTIRRAEGDTAHAYELKFVIDEQTARQVEAWALNHMHRDAFAAADGAYQTTTLYLDTPALDVLRKTEGYRGEKHRLRRYAQESKIYLERKCRKGDRVEKHRSHGPVDDLHILRCNGAPVDWAGHWFRDRVSAQQLRPTCLITYVRNAFVQASPTGPLRLTFDRQIRGIPSSSWELTPVCDRDPASYCVLPNHVVCEFKFRDTLPALFAQVIAEMKLQPGSMSKYGHVMTAAGFTREGGTAHA